MHTIETTINDVDYTIHHNSDWSGEFFLTISRNKYEEVPNSRNKYEEVPNSDIEVRIESDLILELVGRRLADARISEIEDMSGIGFVAKLMGMKDA